MTYATKYAQLPQKQDGSLSEDTTRVLVYLFKANDKGATDAYAIGAVLGMDEGVVKYHLDRLQEAKMAFISSISRQGAHWALKSEGRRHVVEKKLI